MRAGSLPSMLCFLDIEDGGRCRSDMYTPWYVYPRTHITSDMCTPGRDIQNTEALNPGIQTWRLRGTDFVGLYFKVSTDPKLKRSRIYVLLSTADGIIRCIWGRDPSSIYFWQVSRKTTALTGRGYQYYYDHRSVICVSKRLLATAPVPVLFWNILLIRNCTRLLYTGRNTNITNNHRWYDISDHIRGYTYHRTASQWYLSSINLESIIYLLAIYELS